MELEQKQEKRRQGECAENRKSKQAKESSVKHDKQERPKGKKREQDELGSGKASRMESLTETNKQDKTAVLSTKNMSRLSQEEATAYRKLKHIQVAAVALASGGSVAKEYFPLTRFSDAAAHLPCGLVEQYCAGYAEPTPIQSQTWPLALDGCDVVGIAETGSGKTLAFGFPALALAAKVAAQQASLFKGSAFPIALMLAPTRELALQIQETLAKASACISGAPSESLPRSVCIYGGASKHEQARQLARQSGHRNAPLLIVGTPGRVLDFLGDGTLALDALRYLVLDEADRMLDLGFEPDIRRIISFAPPKTQRQTLMFSATWPAAIRKLAAEYLNGSAVHVAIGCHGTEPWAEEAAPPGEGAPASMPSGSLGSLKGCARVEQVVHVVDDPYERDAILVQLLNKYQNASRSTRMIVFVLYKKEADRVESFLQAQGWSAGALHGDKSQSVRCQVLESFKTGQVPLLIATDVAARGLDIPNVEVVVNYSFPLTIEDYVHRIGRTGRAGQSGVSVTLFTPLDKSHSGELIQVLKNSGQPVPEALFRFGTAIKKKEHKDYGAFYRDIDPSLKAVHVKFDD